MLAEVKSIRLFVFVFVFCFLRPGRSGWSLQGVREGLGVRGIRGNPYFGRGRQSVAGCSQEYAAGMFSEIVFRQTGKDEVVRSGEWEVDDGKRVLRFPDGDAREYYLIKRGHALPSKPSMA